MEFKKKFENGREVFAVITVDNRNVVHLNLYVELPVEKKTIFWWKNKIVYERFNVFSTSTDLNSVNTWTKSNFESWVDSAIETSDKKVVKPYKTTLQSN